MYLGDFEGHDLYITVDLKIWKFISLNLGRKRKNELITRVKMIFSLAAHIRGISCFGTISANLRNKVRGLRNPEREVNIINTYLCEFQR